MRIGWMLLLWTLAAAGPGCGVNQAVLTGHDFLDEAAGAMQTGLEEYHADEVQRAAAVRQQLVAAFAADVSASAGDKAKVAAVTQQMLGLLDKADAASQVEQQRRQRLEGWLSEMRQTNKDLRQIAQWKLHWGQQISQYVQNLREKAHGNGSGK